MADPRRRPGGRGNGPRSGGRTPAARRTADPARLAAYDVLVAVRVEGAYANLVLPDVLRKHGLSGRDAGFVTELAAGTLRRQGTYDAIVAACVDRPLAKVEAKVLDALRLGGHQLLSMRVPAHAAISTTVDLVRARVGQGPAGFTNAVLRRVGEHDLAGWVRRVAPDPTTDPVGFAAVAHSHPRWVVAALADSLARSGRPDDLDALLSADNLAPGVTLVARPGRIGRDELVEQTGGTATVLSPYGVALPGGDPGALAAVAGGDAGVQDEGSQLVAVALAAAVVEGRDERWLDLCAGPGGKAALLAALAGSRGARLVANEAQEHRTELVRRALSLPDGSLAPGVEAVVTGDGTAPVWEPGSFDRVLVDAPCSGLGALRRRPESRWRRQPSDLRDLVPLQERLLDAALTVVRPGGVVVYATCSPVPAETVEVVDGVLGRRDDVDAEDATALLPGVAAARGPALADGTPTVQLWPHEHRTDAMFVALLRRR
ncbi:rRNA cytosine-C5-methyltransferase [Nocardioides sp. ChNu-153]|uniref:RsmB/NOP family class I SAM-dependent RNA methyltransferase n=1 Tax=unclassified Nocardioides TaxID=2615069 RepID=UPI002406D355|nr:MULTISPECIES: transcription antitermination factor NusB [unclassified Nocardioides]MDF9717960.1 rRNA cytosine-C5-methyltransferase [Nocardioides sp. ChNu-99]MDN7123001.1 rRNA cytosine-C5-methyltransferase [Nocardioides sp. ChNu-153]